MNLRIGKWVYFAALVVLCIIILQYTFVRMSQPLPITEDNLRSCFLIAGRSHTGYYSILYLIEYSSAHKRSGALYKDKGLMQENFRHDHPGFELVWDEDLLLKYTYYLKEEDLEEIETNIQSQFKNRLTYVKIKILNNDTVNKKQTILLEEGNDDISRYCVYEVFEDRVTPLLYGDRTRLDAAKSCVIAFFAFLVGLIFYFILFEKVLKARLIRLRSGSF